MQLGLCGERERDCRSVVEWDAEAERQTERLGKQGEDRQAGGQRVSARLSDLRDGSAVLPSATPM